MLNALGFKSLKFKCFQVVGIKYQLAPHYVEAYPLDDTTGKGDGVYITKRDASSAKVMRRCKLDPAGLKG